MEMSSYKPGQFSWIDMMAKDVDKAKAFYTGLFGWDAADQHDDKGNYIYTMFTKDGKDAAGLGGMMDDMKKSGMPSVWNSYVSVESADDVAAAVERAGGKVMMPPMDVMEAGRMAIFTDPVGAAFSVWQPKKHIGAGVVSEPNAFAWNELMTTDVDKSKAFYGDVFGWTFEAQPEANIPYEVLKNDGDMNGGVMKMEGEQAERVPPNWSVYFNVADVNQACDRVTELGGAVHVQPMDIGMGHMAVCHDDQGCWFNLIQFKG